MQADQHTINLFVHLYTFHNHPPLTLLLQILSSLISNNPIHASCQMGLLARICNLFIIFFFFFFFLCSPFAISAAQKLKRFDESYGNPFDESYLISGLLKAEGNASIDLKALQLTPDSNQIVLKNVSGRILLNKRFKLWKDLKNSSMVASFNTSFLVNIFPVKNETTGEGLTFLIAPNLSSHSSGSYGQYLGLTDEKTDGNKSNQFVAIELDTLKQDFDPDGNHIGLNINRVNSTRVAPLAEHNITLAPLSETPVFHNVWVDYNGNDKVIEVFIARQESDVGLTPPKPDSPIISHNLDLRDVLNQYSYFGFSGSTGDKVELNCVLRWNLTVDYFPDEKDNTLTIVLAAVLSSLALILLLGLGYYVRRKKMRKSSSYILGALKRLPGSPREFEFKELKNATCNFDEKSKLGQGGYGVVYKGFLGKDNLEIAVKCFSRDSIKGEVDFLAELTIINRLRHKHLVKLFGWCHKNGKLLLVYEYMPKGSLDYHLFVGQGEPPLNWDLRYGIVSDVASALHYLHNEYDERVVHRDLKASNIMLDDNFNARLGDFGLARVLENEKTSYAEAEGVAGTFGYIAPECLFTGKATQQSDVYALGAVLLEVVCGQRPGIKVGNFNTLVDWVWFLHRDGRILEAVDTRLGENYVVDEAERLLLLALACSHPVAAERPKTQGILQIITGSAPPPDVPPFKPSFVWPPSLQLDIDSSFEDTTSIYTSSHFSSV